MENQRKYVGVQVLSLTCDGPSCHFVMMKRLGANLDPYNMDSSFQHPCEPDKRVYVMLDTCHTLSFLKVVFEGSEILLDKDGQLMQ